MDAIACKKLSRRFGRTVAVDRLDLQVGVGQVYGFLGPNRAGKTTTIRMLLGLVAPTAARSILIERARECGRRAELIIDGQARPLADATELAGYRVVQECLTNAIRHAACSAASSRPAGASRASSCGHSSRAPHDCQDPACRRPACGTGWRGPADRNPGRA